MYSHSQKFPTLGRFFASAGLAVVLGGCGPSLQTSVTVPRQTIAADKAPSPALPADLAHSPVGSVVDRYCLSCHGKGKSRGGLSLEELFANFANTPDPKKWQSVVEQVDGFAMPPDDEAQPTEDERTLLTSWIDSNVFKFDCSAVDPGRTTAHRLNRQEYENTVQSLLGVSVPLANLLPVDTSGLGFDSLADTLTTSPLLIERYLDAADAALDVAIYDPKKIKRQKLVLPVDLAEAGHGARPRGDGWMILTSDQQDDLGVSVSTPIQAQYKFAVFAQNWRKPPTKNAPPPTAPDPKKPLSITLDVPVLSILVDDTTQHRARVTGTPSSTSGAWYEAIVTVPPGNHHIRVAVMRDPASLELAAQRQKIPQGLSMPPSFRMELAVKTIELDGPLNPPGQAWASHKQLFFQSPKNGDKISAATAILERFTNRAFRRTASKQELEPLLALAEQAWAQGASFENGVRRSLQAVLVSAPFLFRLDSDPAKPLPSEVVALEETALASRLSYFLWSDMPDDELLAEAQQGTLRRNLVAQVNRMIDHPKAERFVTNFGGQWLQFRNIDDAAPAFYIFPKFDEPLRAAMKEETVRFFRYILTQNEPVLDFLRADYTFANEKLAQHYGLQGVVGNEFRKVSLASTPRRGVLTHGSILTITSSTTRTSPVKRGKWVLETLLNAPQPPPPPDVPELPEGRDVKGSVRELLEEHRKNPACASCHARMDPIGFGFENFDGVGEFRTKDNGSDVDASGEMSGRHFTSSAELLSILAETKGDAFIKAFTSRLLTYALSRGLTPPDKCVVESILQTTKPNGYRFRDFIMAIVQSPSFLYTRGDEVPSRLVTMPINKGAVAASGGHP